MRRVTVIAVGVLASGLVVSSPVPQVRAEATFAADLVHTPTYLVCAGTTKLAQANAVLDGAKAVGWDSFPPSQSYQTGAGCGSAEAFPVGSSEPDPVLDLPLAGTFTGNLSAMTVRLHAVDTSARAVERQSLLVDVSIDGRPRVRGAEVEVDTVRPSPGATGYVEFSVTNIGLLDELDSGAAHVVELRISTRYADFGTLNGWVWDATEFPSGITFNPARLAPVRVRAER